MQSEVLEVIKLRDIIRITNVPGLVPGLSPPTLEITGEDFSSAETVIVSGVEVTEFVVLNRFTIYAAMPPKVSSIHSLEVLSGDFTRVAEASRIIFRVGDRPRFTKGLYKLIQHFLMWLLRDPSKDLFTPGSGGGLQSIVGSLINSKNALQLRAAVMRSIQTTSEQIQRTQASVRNLPMDERLLSAEIMSLGQVSADDIRARIRVTSFANNEGVASLRL